MILYKFVAVWETRYSGIEVFMKTSISVLVGPNCEMFSFLHRP